MKSKTQDNINECSHSREHVEAEKNLIKAVNEMTEQVERLREMELLQVLKHPWKLVWYSLLKGLMIGFGSVIGATVLITIFVYLLAELSNIPVLGDFLDNLLSKTETTQQDTSKGNILLDQYNETKKSLENNNK
ncbi:hypothetical protein COY05_03425 [Candidatus Peregrinibacteria bacterium CG_4_10_14_0_2_um_filter_38_24]|nr:MAG: hypothetical protein COY05_03425 [Candidatus Peregrinibacteria bacterium CG_4_10_14_0_2_um_filter_38_24]PJC38780.1 MAG: hypothetical protein CO044_03195 [Candidatus Peregrinibacteria bacterium CG_4_9_14_0_2_um_filter_38_9]